MEWVEVGKMEGRRETVGERRGRGKVSGGDGRDDGRAATNACSALSFFWGDAEPQMTQLPEPPKFTAKFRKNRGR